MVRVAIFSLPLVALALWGCSEEVGNPDDAGGGGQGTGNSGSGGDGGEVDLTNEGEPLDVEVPEEGTVFVTLDPPAVLGTDEALFAETSWDLAFTGYQIQTNGGVSGPGVGSAFGPLSAPLFLGDEAPEVPFLIEDRFGGAFLDWYDYDGESHGLFSRYHVHGVRRGSEIYKVQILAYYGEIEGAPVSGLYSLRYARLDAGGTGETTTVDALDGTAGGVSGGPDAPAECLRLADGERMMLSPDEALASNDWDLCFRREFVSVNGGEGGPADVEAVDLMRDEIPNETLDAVKAKTPASELGAFDGVDLADLEDPEVAWVADGLITAFTGRWALVANDPPTPELATWWVIGPDGTSGAMVAFIEFSGAGATTPGTVHMRIKAVQ